MLNISVTTIKKAGLVLVWPISQLLLLRIFVHSVLQLRFGFVRTTDFDFAVPAPVAFIVLLHALENAVPLTFKIQKKALLTNFACTALFLAINLKFDTLALLSPLGVVSAWFACLAGIVITSFCIFVDPRYYLKNPHRFAFLPCLLIAGSMYFYMNDFHQTWEFFGTVTAVILQKTFSIIPFSNITSVFTPEDAVKIVHPRFAVRISKGCGGLDAFFFFTLVFLLGRMLQQNVVRFTRWLPVYLYGLVLMFGLNLFRIVVLFFVGIWMQELLPHELANNLFKSFFHMHFGWFIYSVAIVSYLRYWNLRWEREPEISRIPVAAAVNKHSI